MINYVEYKPKVIPYNGDIAEAQIDRVQSIDPSPSRNSEKVNEMGRDGAVGYSKKTPSVPYSLSQLEYGNFEFWTKIANKPDATTTLTLADFTTPAVDLYGVLTDDDGTFFGIKHYPEQRVTGFAINIGDPEADIERSFDFIGENAITWQGLYLIGDDRHTVVGDGSDEAVTLSKTPAIDPDKDVSGDADEKKYFIRVLRVRAGVTTELTYTTDYTYDSVAAPTTLVIVSVLDGDVIKPQYVSTSAPTNIFVNNDSDPVTINAQCVDIELVSGDATIYRLQSVGMEVSFEREDLGEIGNIKKVQRGVADKNVTITLDRNLEDLDLEAAMRGVDSTYKKIDITKFTDDLGIRVKIYTDNTKATFKYGFKATGLASSDLSSPGAVKEYTKSNVTLIGDVLTISSLEADLV